MVLKVGLLEVKIVVIKIKNSIDRLNKYFEK